MALLIKFQQPDGMEILILCLIDGIDDKGHAPPVRRKRNISHHLERLQVVARKLAGHRNILSIY
jgi:hypothetical protein